ncbi:DMT family transporter [bacterium endosymbiont of Pedicinus badii]|uniref:DMT family transporter n=1 Tax=bacterium endosymbiont of Pedicinus badii TaxID=1719126 RepID=UPI0009B9F7DF|nr:DMT family transporter [bacterium endosymbiont of Pedicinus badii]OQM34302.1 hypothetical protein AOQ89_00165 [bacterium endosymbiont of Pedicinus badii]
MTMGIFFAIIAGFFWGFIFIIPTFIPEYPGLMQSCGRYMSFGLFSIILSWKEIKKLKYLKKKDWITATKLSFVGNILYYACLSGAIQKIGAPISTIVIGILPLTISLYSIWHSKNTKKNNNFEIISYESLFLSILCIVFGLILINLHEIRSFSSYSSKISFFEYFYGFLLANIALFCWTWYPIKNLHWLKKNSKIESSTWTTAQGIVTFPLSLLVYFLVCINIYVNKKNFPLPFGPNPYLFIFLMLTLGIFCSFLGLLFWNKASKIIPSSKMGSMIIFEVIFGIIYAFLLKKKFPSILFSLGIIFILLGVFITSKIKKNKL